MTTRRHLFTSESVSEGHPDKLADQVSDAVLDACLAEDPQSRVACETFTTTGMILKLPLDSTAAPESVHLPSDSLSLPHAMVLVDVHVMNTCAMWHQRLNLITLRSIRKVC